MRGHDFERFRAMLRDPQKVNTEETRRELAQFLEITLRMLEARGRKRSDVKALAVRDPRYPRYARGEEVQFMEADLLDALERLMRFDDVPASPVPWTRDRFQEWARRAAGDVFAPAFRICGERFDELLRVCTNREGVLNLAEMERRIPDFAMRRATETN